MEKEKCPYCNKEVKIVHSTVIYGPGHDYGNMKCCANFPACDSYAGMGASLADAELRDLRKKCHALFDARWKHGGVSRSQCYHWLKVSMGMKSKDAHIARFRKDQCLRLLDLLDPNRWIYDKKS